MSLGNKELLVCNLGRTRYVDTWDFQHKLVELRQRGVISDLLLFTEHEHVYTIGKAGDDNHLLASAEELLKDGTDVFHIDRGGDITYHGPGQIVGYPILDLNQHTPDIHLYLRKLEDVMIGTLLTFGVEGRREEGMTGVWTGGEKIAAIGVKVSRWVTMHGFALNVNTDLAKFARIIPCGIFHKGVTSMEQILGRKVPTEAVVEQLTESFASTFGSTPAAIAPAVLRERAKASRSEMPIEDSLRGETR